MLLNCCVPRPRQLTRGVFNTPHEPPVSCHGFSWFCKDAPPFPARQGADIRSEYHAYFQDFTQRKPTHAENAIALQRLCRQISGQKSLKRIYFALEKLSKL